MHNARMSTEIGTRTPMIIFAVEEEVEEVGVGVGVEEVGLDVEIWEEVVEANSELGRAFKPRVGSGRLGSKEKTSIVVVHSITKQLVNLFECMLNHAFVPEYTVSSFMHAAPYS